MGKLKFIEYAEGVDLEAAFAAAVEVAQFEHGHGGYTGTIAEKDGFGCAALTDELTPFDQAVELAKKLLNEDDDRWKDSDTPAYGIPVRGGERTHFDVPVPAAAEGWYPSRDAAVAAALADRLTDGETISRIASLALYGIGRGGRVVATSRCRVSVRTTGAAVHTGWLFFGYAQY